VNGEASQVSKLKLDKQVMSKKAESKNDGNDAAVEDDDDADADAFGDSILGRSLKTSILVPFVFLQSLQKM
jgi:hypothetical protein